MASLIALSATVVGSSVNLRGRSVYGWQTDSHFDASKWLFQPSHYEQMRIDENRTPLYYEAIRRRVTRDTVVLDLGTGAQALHALEAARAGALAVGAPGGARAALAPLLSGYSPAVWAIVGLKALGGLLVAATVKYTDNILKNYATAISILLTVSATSLWTATPPSLGFATGTLAVLASVFMYSERKPKPPR